MGMSIGFGLSPTVSRFAGGGGGGVTPEFGVALASGASIKTSTDALFTYLVGWIKDRANAASHQLYDSVRGTGLILEPDDATVEQAYSAPAGSSLGWAWELSSTGGANTDGSINTTVALSPSDAVAAILHNGSGANATLGHGMSGTPEMYFTKTRDSADWWAGYHKDLTDASYYIRLDSTQKETQKAIIWNSTAPDASVISVGTDTTTNASGDDFLTLAFRSISGILKVGSYTGNTTTEPSITGLGATGRAVLIIRIDDTGNRVMIDSDRGDEYVYANSTSTEGSAAYVDWTADGFDVAPGVTNSDINANGGTYIYLLMA